MKFSALLLLAVSYLFACKKANIDDGYLSPCLKSGIKNYKKNASDYSCQGYAVAEYLFEGRKVYSFNSPDCLADGSTAVLNENCNTICSLGGLAGNMNCNGKRFADSAVFTRYIWKP